MRGTSRVTQTGSSSHFNPLEVDNPLPWQKPQINIPKVELIRES